MSHLKYILFCILVLALQPQIFCDAPTGVSNGNTDTIDFATTVSKKYHFTYASGTNHTLPTSGYAKAYSGVNLDSFCRKITFQELTAEGVKSIGPTVAIMAENELLDAHKNAMTFRMNN